MRINGIKLLSALATTTNYVLKQSSTDGTLIDSQIVDDGTNVTIGGGSNFYKFNVNGGMLCKEFVFMLGSSSDFRGYDFDGTPIGNLGFNKYVGANYGTYGNLPIYFFTNGAEGFRLSENGNVGIGTTTPLYKLQVGGTTSDILGIGTTSYGGSSGQALAALTVREDGGGIGGSLDFQTLHWGSSPYGLQTRMSIDPNGNVGIGTIVPSTKLEVFSTDSTGTRTSPHDVLTLTAENDNAPYNGFGGGIVFKNRAYTSGIVTSTRIRSQINNASVDTFGGSLHFEVTPTVGGILTEAMLINYNGNVGIGTATPATKLDVNGVGSFVSYAAPSLTPQISGDYGQVITMNRVGTGLSSGLGIPASGDLGFYSNNVETARITSAGNVGIGTTTPTFKLDINSGTSGSAFRVLSTNTTSLRTFFEATAGNVEQHFLYTGNQDWVLGLDKADSNKFKLASSDDAFASSKLTVTTGGNIGIGTTVPQSKLEIEDIDRGTTNLYAAANLAVYTNDVMSADKGGTLSLGGKALNDIKYGFGAIKGAKENSTNGDISGYLSLYTSSSGVGSVERMRITSSGNVGIGTTTPAKLLDVAGDALINGLTVGRGGANDLSSVAVGFQALKNQTGGGKHVAIGLQALLNNTFGQSNIAIGFQALLNNTEGSYNLAIGGAAGIGLSIGNYNNIIGTGLSFNPDGTSFDGSYALSIGKNSVDYTGYPHIWAPESISCSSLTSAIILKLDYGLYSGVLMDYCIVDEVGGNSRVGTYKATFRSTGGGIAYSDTDSISSGTMTDFIIVTQTNFGFIEIILQNNSFSDTSVTINHSSRLLLRG